jgi:hypothetical protein
MNYSPSHRQAGASMINIRSTFRIAFDLCKNISLVVLFGSNGNSYSLYAVRYVYICASSMYLWLHIQSLVDVVSVLIWRLLSRDWYRAT